MEQEIQKLIENAFWGEIQMDFHDEKWDGKHFFLAIVSDTFDGKSRIERSQMVYELLDPFMKTGSIHALRMNLKTPQEIL